MKAYMNRKNVMFAVVLALGLLVGFQAMGMPVIQPDMLAGLSAVGMVPMMTGEVGGEMQKVLDAVKDHSEKLTNAITKTTDELKEHGKVQEATKNEIADLSTKQAALEKRLADAEQLVVRAGQGNGDTKVKTAGQYLVESDVFKAMSGKKIGKKSIQEVLELDLKNITSASNSAGPGIWSLRDPEIVRNPYRPRMLRSLIPTVPISTNLVEWVQVKTRTNNADMVSEGGAKPKSDLSYERKESSVRKIAHYFKTSMEALQDFPRLQGEIDTEGMEMLKQVEEDQLIAGDGTGVNLLGLIPQATAYNTGLNVSGDTAVDKIRHAILQVRMSFYGATGIVLNPQDWHDIELLKDNDNAYLFSSVTTGAQPRLWGLPVVECDALGAGEFMVGAFATAATIYDRMQAAMFISTENEDDFIKNMVSIVLEERLALTVKRPLAFVHGDL